VVILGQYSDLALSQSRDAYHNLFFGATGKTIAGYFRENSHGQFQWTNGGVVGPYTPVNNPNSIVDESTFNCALDWRDARGNQLCQGTLATAASTEAATLVWAGSPSGGNIDFALFDRDRNGTVTGSELGLVFTGPAPFAAGGQTSGFCPNVTVSTDPAMSRDGGVRVCLSRSGVAEFRGPSFDLLAHEISHMLGTIDVYGSACLSDRLSLMSCSDFTASEASFHLDPWHKTQLGWERARIYSVTDPGATAELRTASFAGDPRPVILFDPRLGKNEYFIVEYRMPQGYDGSIADQAGGVAVWHVRTNPDGTLQVVPDGINPGNTDGDAWNWVVGCGPDVDGNGTYVGQSTLCRSEHGSFSKTWSDRTSRGLSMRVGTAAASGSSSTIGFQWYTGGTVAEPATRLDRIGYDAVSPTQQFVLFGDFGVQQGSKVVALEGAGVDLIVRDWRPRQVTVEVPAGVVPGYYRVVLYNNAAQLGVSDGLSVQVSVSLRDGDRDGCTDQQENGSNEAAGGRRDMNNFYDFFDTPTGGSLARDRRVTISDINAVISRFGSVGGASIDPLSTPLAAPAYHTAFDRTAPAAGGDAWDLRAPDGRITVADLTLVLGQFGHTCA
jgi:M6 family metalloprotease-like protein